ncbi:MAG: hypothetical protein AB8B50_06540 [Pirellulaceae bacterium]
MASEQHGLDSAYFASIAGQAEADNLRIRQFPASVAKLIPIARQAFHFAFPYDDY